MSSKAKVRALNAKIVKRLEFYFSDVNLERDKFFQDEIKNNDGWVPLDVLFDCNRLNSLTTDKSAIAAALKYSETVEISEDNEKVRKSPPGRKFLSEIKIPIVYVESFPSDTTPDDIMGYLKPHEEILDVILRKIKDTNIFKGSIYVKFKNEASAKNFINSEDTRKFKDHQLIRVVKSYNWAKIPHYPVNFLKGQIMHISGLPAAENLTISSTKEFFNKFGSVAYVVYEEGSSEAGIRFEFEENAAIKALQKMNDEVTEEAENIILFQGHKIHCKVLENEEEKKHWERFSKNKLEKAYRTRIPTKKRGGNYISK